ncbi:MAG: 2OG-Fe(II) oxygenase [Alphaproteobacteria bacterium]|nr:2OG-Fe(II) oxygenase [Alphaproteobacteria bacterium]
MTYVWRVEDLLKLGMANAESYRRAAPFPHACFDNFLTDEVIDRILAEFPAPDSGYWSTKNRPDTIKQDTTPGLGTELKMPPAIREMMWQLNSSAFLIFLRHLTGIAGLVPDPYLFGGGIHQILPGGLLKIHADFNIHEIIGLYRRINVLIYLNRDWKPEYGGNIELWSRDMTRREKSFEPIAGRCIIFNTDDDSYHGHPDPLTCPPGTSRKSIAMYYYTAAPPPRGSQTPHNTLWQRRPGEQY